MNGSYSFESSVVYSGKYRGTLILEGSTGLGLFFGVCPKNYGKSVKVVVL